MPSSEHHLVVISSADLENAFRRVLSDVLDQKEQERIAREEAQKNAKINRNVASERLKKDLSTLYRWEKAGMLHPIKVGRTVYYLEAEIRNIEQGRSK